MTTPPPPPITRYHYVLAQDLGGNEVADMHENEHGSYVLYADHLTALAAVPKAEGGAGRVEYVLFNDIVSAIWDAPAIGGGLRDPRDATAIANAILSRFAIITKIPKATA